MDNNNNRESRVGESQHVGKRQRLGEKQHIYTPEEKEFIVSFVPGHTYRETREAFTKRFGWEITRNQLEGCMVRYGVRSGIDARFKKGHVPTNKGVKGYHSPGCEKTWFKKGSVPKNCKPIGTERVVKGGYISVKVAQPNIWKSKQRLIYEQTYGPIPENHIIIFKDNNKRNFSPDNLMAITKKQNAVLNHERLFQYKGDMKETAVLIADMKIVAKKARKKVGIHP